MIAAAADPTTLAAADRPTSPNRTYRLTTAERLLIAGGIVGVAHHVDHILRVDHSGWPFIAQVTPFTASLLVYPIVLAIFLLRGRPWLRVGLAALLFVAVQSAHIFMETPDNQYHSWAAGVSNSRGRVGVANLLHIHSTALGIGAAALSILLSVMLIAVVVAFLREALAARRRA